MITNPDVRARRIRKLIEQFGGGTPKTNALSALSPAIVAELRTHVAFGERETGLLAFYGGPGQWLLLTSGRLIWKQGGQQFELGWEDVQGVQQPPKISARVIRGELAVETVEDLEIFDSRGKRHLLHLERGEGYNLVWSAITALSNYLRPPDEIELATEERVGPV